MSAKPTPGPYNTFQVSGGTAVHINGICIAVFYDAEGCQNGVSEAQAEANARAWVDGMAAMEMLAQVRQALVTNIDASDAVAEIEKILDEAKP